MYLVITNMRTTEIILDILDGMKAEGMIAQRHYVTPSRQNVDLGQSQYPCAVLNCITDWKIDLATGREREQCSINLSILEPQPALAFDGEDNEKKVDRCKEIAVDAIARIMRSDDVEIVEDTVTGRTIFDDTDYNVTGVSVAMTVREKDTHCLV